MTTPRPEVWRSRHYLPHYDRPGALQMITWQLRDALPRAALERLLQATALAPAMGNPRRPVETLLDTGLGACHLRDPRVAQMVEAALLYHDGRRYALLAWTIMPNHVHLLVRTRPGWSLQTIVHSWKSFTAHRANRILGRSGSFWYADYFDRVIRDERHLRAAIRYIDNNPVRARLVDTAEQWPFGSAARPAR